MGNQVIEHYHCTIPYDISRLHSHAVGSERIQHYYTVAGYVAQLEAKAPPKGNKHIAHYHYTITYGVVLPHFSFSFSIFFFFFFLHIAHYHYTITYGVVLSQRNSQAMANARI